MRNNESMTQLKQQAQLLIGQAAAKSMKISDDGEVTGGDASAAEAIAKQVKELVTKATEADEFIAKALRVVFGTKHNFDAESRVFGAERDEASWSDSLTETKLEGVMAAMRHHYNYEDAANLLEHWLDGSGKPYEVDTQKMLKDMPQFQKDVNADLTEVKKGQDGKFETEWSDSRPDLDDGPSNLNWYYALNNFEYRLVGEKQGDEVTYQVEVRKQYDWGTPSEHRADLEKGPVHLEQADIAHLNSVGFARDFQVHGKTGQLTG
ncbi:hypothetical protein MOQ72_42890 [Saccharopolyspora sp. K220]|uniref:hypothetical protein n=1 Tax=Saccharopolyspora soli TaxID=2926618 RepID=UPI001F56508B|nr:hypothetical protein [Saccharopolyspora soli]MCI2424162.1 hypothetical protein [Saccharopolyspora soli]